MIRHHSFESSSQTYIGLISSVPKLLLCTHFCQQQLHLRNTTSTDKLHKRQSNESDALGVVLKGRQPG